jgi:zinc transporter ZupT
MQSFIFSIFTVISTTIGGLVAIKYKDKLHRILGFTAGVILGVIAFDLLPEIFQQVHESAIASEWPMVALVVGFLAFHIIEKSIILHNAHDSEYHGHSHPQVGVFSALMLVGHSFLDGVGIGLAFTINQTLGFAVTLAVIAHDFADGMNTVGLLLRHGNTVKRSKLFLLFDALAPMLGVLSTHIITVGAKGLTVYLGLFCGVLLYICAGDILPEAHAKHSSRSTMLLTIAGAGFMFFVTRFL